MKKVLTYGLAIFAVSVFSASPVLGISSMLAAGWLFFCSKGEHKEAPEELSDEEKLLRQIFPGDKHPSFWASLKKEILSREEYAALLDKPVSDSGEELYGGNDVTEWWEYYIGVSADGSNTWLKKGDTLREMGFKEGLGIFRVWGFHSGARTNDCEQKGEYATFYPAPQVYHCPKCGNEKIPIPNEPGDWERCPSCGYH